MSWTHTCTGNNRVLIVAVAVPAGKASKVTGATYNGDSMTQIWSNSGGYGYENVGYRLVAPDTGGAYTVLVSFSESLSGVYAVSASYTGVNQTIPEGTPENSDNYSMSASDSIASATGELVLGSMWIESSGWSKDAGQTLVVDSLSGVSTGIHLNSKAGAASVTLTWTGSNNIWWTLSLIALKPAT